ELLHELLRRHVPLGARGQLAGFDGAVQPVAEGLGAEYRQIALFDRRKIEVVEVKGKGAFEGIHVLDAPDEAQTHENEQVVNRVDEALLKAFVQFEQVLKRAGHAVLTKQIQKIDEKRVVRPRIVGGN